MQTMINKRSIVIAGHKTSVSLEDPFWNALKDIGRNQETTLSKLISDIDTQRQNGNLSSAIRLFVLAHFRGSAASDEMVPRTSAPLSVSQTPQGNGSTLASAVASEGVAASLASADLHSPPPPRL